MRQVLVFISLFLFFRFTSFGQQPDTTYNTSIDHILMDDIRITAQFKPTHYKKALHEINIINQKSLDFRGVNQLDEALLSVPSLRLNYDPVLGTRVTMRGISSSNVAILIDGVPVIGRLNGAIDISQLPLQNVQRIEIVEGPLSGVYGNNAAGGVINIITKQSTINKWGLKASSQVESIKSHNHKALFSYNSKKLYTDIHGSYYNYNQFPVDSLRIIDQQTLGDGSVLSQSRYPWNPKELFSYGIKSRYRFNDDHSLQVKYDFLHENLRDYGLIRRPNYKPYANDNFYTSRRNDFSIAYDGKIKNKYYLESITSYNSFQRITDEKRTDIESGDFDPIWAVSDTNNFDAFFNRSQIGFSTLPSLELMVGTNVSYNEVKGDRIKDSSKKDSTISSLSESAIYADIKWSPLSKVTLGTTQRFTYNNQYKHQWTPAFFAKYNLSKNLLVRSSYSHGFRSPSLKELHLEFIDVNHFISGNPDLQPELSRDFRLGAYYDNKKYTWELSAYITKIFNKIGLVETETLVYTYDNIDSYSVQGIQVQVGYSLNKFKVSSSLNVGYWSTNLSDDDLPQYGQVMDLNNNLSYNFKEQNLFLSINHRHIGKQPIYYMNNEELEVFNVASREMIDFSINKNFYQNKFAINAGVKNLLNQKSAAITGISSGGGHSNEGSRLLSRGRSIFIKLSVNLSR